MKDIYPNYGNMEEDNMPNLRNKTGFVQSKELDS